MQKNPNAISGWESVKVIDPNTVRIGFSVADDEERDGLPPTSDGRHEILPGYDPEEIYPDEPYIPQSSSQPSQDHRNGNAVPRCEMDEVFPEPPQYPPVHQNHYPRRYLSRPRRQIPEDLQDMILLGVGLLFIWIALLIFT